MSGLIGIPPAAIAIALDAGAITRAQLELAGAPSARHVRRAMLCSAHGAFREELRRIGLTKGEISLWLRTARVPERLEVIYP